MVLNESYLSKERKHFISSTSPDLYCMRAQVPHVSNLSTSQVIELPRKLTTPTYPPQRNGRLVLRYSRTENPLPPTGDIFRIIYCGPLEARYPIIEKVAAALVVSPQVSSSCNAKERLQSFSIIPISAFGSQDEAPDIVLLDNNGRTIEVEDVPYEEIETLSQGTVTSICSNGLKADLIIFVNAGADAHDSHSDQHVQANTCHKDIQTLHISFRAENLVPVKTINTISPHVCLVDDVSGEDVELYSLEFETFMEFEAGELNRSFAYFARQKAEQDLAHCILGELQSVPHVRKSLGACHRRILKVSAWLALLCASVAVVLLFGTDLRQRSLLGGHHITITNQVMKNDEPTVVLSLEHCMARSMTSVLSPHDTRGRSGKYLSYGLISLVRQTVMQNNTRKLPPQVKICNLSVMTSQAISTELLSIIDGQEEKLPRSLARAVLGVSSSACTDELAEIADVQYNTTGMAHADKISDQQRIVLVLQRCADESNSTHENARSLYAVLRARTFRTGVQKLTNKAAKTCTAALLTIRDIHAASTQSLTKLAVTSVLNATERLRAKADYATQLTRKTGFPPLRERLSRVSGELGSIRNPSLRRVRTAQLISWRRLLSWKNFIISTVI